MTAAAGMPAYEISNHARPGCESRHNLTYWRYTDYVGIGPGAHGRRSGVATVRHKKPENWISALARNGHGAESETPLAPDMRLTEAMLMGLRLREGVDLARVAALGGRDVDGVVDARAATLLEAEGLIMREGHRLRATDAGMPVLNAVIAALIG